MIQENQKIQKLFSKVFLAYHAFIVLILVGTFIGLTMQVLNQAQQELIRYEKTSWNSVIDAVLNDDILHILLYLRANLNNPIVGGIKVTIEAGQEIPIGEIHAHADWLNLQHSFALKHPHTDAEIAKNYDLC